MKAIDVVIAVAQALRDWDGSPEQAADKLSKAVEAVKSFAAPAQPAPSEAKLRTMKEGEVCRNFECQFFDMDMEQNCSGATEGIEGPAAEFCTKWQVPVPSAEEHGPLWVIEKYIEYAMYLTSTFMREGFVIDDEAVTGALAALRSRLAQREVE